MRPAHWPVDAGSEGGPRRRRDGGGNVPSGSQAAVEGRLFHDEWTGGDGQRVSRLIVIAYRVEFLDGPSSISTVLLTTRSLLGTPETLAWR